MFGKCNIFRARAAACHWCYDCRKILFTTRWIERNFGARKVNYFYLEVDISSLPGEFIFMYMSWYMVLHSIVTILHYPTGINPSTSPQWSIWILWDCDLNLSCASSPGINFLAFHTDSCIIVDLSFGIKPLGGKLKSNILPRPRQFDIWHRLF